MNSNSTQTIEITNWKVSGVENCRSRQWLYLMNETDYSWCERRNVRRSKRSEWDYQKTDVFSELFVACLLNDDELKLWFVITSK